MKNKLFTGLASLLLLTLLLASCKKDSSGTDTTPTGNGMAPGECRITRMDDTSAITYTSENKISKVSTYFYTYTSNKVILTDKTHDNTILIFNLDAKGFPVNMEEYGLSDTIAQSKTWFVYNADSTLAISRTYNLFTDKYVLQGKNVYTWTNKNLTRVVTYGSDTINGQLLVNVAYDLTKIDKRKSNYEKLYTYSPVYVVDFLPKCASVNLATDLQMTVTGQPASYYKISQTLNTKNYVTQEVIKDLAGQEVYHQNFSYECN